MPRRALHGGMIVFLLVALLVAGARPASADTGLGMRAWRWLVSVWAQAGPEIDPNGSHLELPPPPPPMTPTSSGSGVTTSGQGSSPSSPGEGNRARTQATSPR